MDAKGTDRNQGPTPPAVSDEQLMDWSLGQLESPQREQVEQSLAESPALRARADAVQRTLSVLGQWEAEEPAADLADRVRQRVALARGYHPRRAARPSIFSLAEVGAVAAAILLLALVFVPPANRANVRYKQLLCQDHMRRIGVAMEHYANEYANALPFMSLPAGGNWLNRDNGRQPTGTAPVFMLVREGRIQPEDMICPACKDASFVGDPSGLVDFPNAQQCSYSFQNLFGASRPMVRDSVRIVPVLADRNPLFRNGSPSRDVVGNSNSFNHNREGQNVLYNDGEVRWETRPDVGFNHDNIWLAGQTTVYRGTETSQGPDDSFFAP